MVKDERETYRSSFRKDAANVVILFQKTKLLVFIAKISICIHYHHHI